MRSFALLDHKCPELEKLLEEKKISFEWAVCYCSPSERSYQILEEGKWRDISNCPFCEESMTGAMFPSPDFAVTPKISAFGNASSLAAVFVSKECKDGC